MVREHKKDSCVLILGGGRTGESVKTYCQKNGIDFELLADTKDADEVLDVLVRAATRGIESAILSPGIPECDPVMRYLEVNNIPVCGELGFAAGLLDCPIYAITGTNGKTTTTTLLAKMLTDAKKDARAVGNIGTPLISLAMQGCSKEVIAVVEVSSFQLLHANNFSPEIACILNITPDHLDRHGTMEEYIKAKTRIFDHMKSDGYCILNADDSILSKLEPKRGRRLYVSLNREVDGAYLKDGSVYVNGLQLFDTAILKIRGRHNLQNAMFASLCAFLAGVSKASITDTLASFCGVRHRMEVVAEHGGKVFINDSKATNIAASLLAAKSIEMPTIMILGGSDKSLEFNEFFLSVPKSVRHIFCTGETERAILDAAARNGFKSITACHSFDNATQKAFECTIKRKGKTALLLSPACASFDEFKDYAERGERFCEIIKSSLT